MADNQLSLKFGFNSLLNHGFRTWTDDGRKTDARVTTVVQSMAKKTG